MEMTWYKWTILGATVAIPIVMVVLFVIEWTRFRKPRIKVTLAEASYELPVMLNILVKIHAVLSVEHANGPATQILSIRWNGVDDRTQANFTLRPGNGTNIIDKLENGNCVELAGFFELLKEDVTIRDDRTIRGTIRVEGTRNCRTRIKCAIAPFKE